MHTPNDTFNTQGKLKKQTYLIIQCVTVCYTSHDAPTRTCFKPPPLSCRSLSFHWLPIYLDFLDLGAISISIIFHFKNTTDDLHFLRWPAAPEPEITPPPRPHPPRSLVPPPPPPSPFSSHPPSLFLVLPPHLDLVSKNETMAERAAEPEREQRSARGRDGEISCAD